MNYNVLLLGAYPYAAEFESIVEEDPLICLGVIGIMWLLFVGYLLYSLLFEEEGRDMWGEKK